MTQINARYNGYPLFQARLGTLLKERQAQHTQLLHEWSKRPCTKEHTHAFEAELDEIDKKYEERVTEAHRAYGVPVLSNWKDALKATGRAIYHDLSGYPRRTCQATLTATEDHITLDLHEVFTFSPEKAHDLDLELLHRATYTDTWETLPKEENTADGR